MASEDRLFPEEVRKKLVSKIVQGPFMVMDSKEHSKNPQIVQSLQAQGITVEVHSLKAGDYWIPSPEGKDLLIERKTAFDLIHTLRENRLWDQLKAIASLPEVRPVFLLEGSPTIIRKFSSWNESSITQILWAIHDFNINFMFSPSRYWTGISLAQKCKSMCAEKKYRIYPLRVKVKRDMSDDEWARYIVEGLPNTSGVLSDRLLRELKTPLNVFNASPEELSKIEGFGPKKIERIRQVLNREYHPKEKKKEG